MTTPTRLTASSPAWPPGPDPRWGGLPWMAESSRDFIACMQRMHREFGDIAHVQVLNEHIFTVFSPELIREVVVDNAAHLVRQERSIEVVSEFQGRHSVMVSEAETWQRQHRILRAGFSPKRVAGYARLMVDAARKGLDVIAGEKGQTEGKVVNVSQLMNELTSDVILRTLFSQPSGPERDEVIRAVQALDEIAMREVYWPMTLPDWLPLPGKARKRWGLKVLNGLISARIAQRHADLKAGHAPDGDLLAMMLAARDEENTAARGTQPGLSAAEIHDQCKVMFLAGHETSAVAMTWWAWLMATHPDAAQRAWQEVDQVIGQRDPTPEDAARLPWLTATLKEAMRLYPPAPSLLARRTTADIRVGQWTIPKGGIVMLVHWAAHHDARWFKDPEAFLPDRFMPEAPAIPRGAWMPFGAGPRVCMGQHFAMLEMTLITAMLLQRHELQREPSEPAPQAEMQFTLRPRQPLRLRFTPREPSQPSAARPMP
ncbi:MAG: cytochrome P450 [Aquabacterium sp.]